METRAARKKKQLEALRPSQASNPRPQQDLKFEADLAQLRKLRQQNSRVQRKQAIQRQAIQNQQRLNQYLTHKRDGEMLNLILRKRIRQDQLVPILERTQSLRIYCFQAREQVGARLQRLKTSINQVNLQAREMLEKLQCQFISTIRIVQHLLGQVQQRVNRQRLRIIPSQQWQRQLQVEIRWRLEKSKQLLDSLPIAVEKLESKVRKQQEQEEKQEKQEKQEKKEKQQKEEKQQNQTEYQL